MEKIKRQIQSISQLNFSKFTQVSPVTLAEQTFHTGLSPPIKILKMGSRSRPYRSLTRQRSTLIGSSKKSF